MAGMGEFLTGGPRRQLDLGGGFLNEEISDQQRRDAALAELRRQNAAAEAARLAEEARQAEAERRMQAERAQAEQQVQADRAAREKAQPSITPPGTDAPFPSLASPPTIDIRDDRASTIVNGIGEREAQAVDQALPEGRSLVRRPDGSFRAPRVYEPVIRELLRPDEVVLFSEHEDGPEKLAKAGRQPVTFLTHFEPQDSSVVRQELGGFASGPAPQNDERVTLMSAGNATPPRSSKDSSAVSQLIPPPPYLEKLRRSPLETFMDRHRPKPIIRREEWTKSPPYPKEMVRGGAGSDGGAYTEIVFHHTASKETPQSVYDYHVKGRNGVHTPYEGPWQDWGDVGYHFMIAKDGTIYEGRHISYQGSHVAGYNPGKIGVAFLGDYTNEPNTPDQLAAASHLIDSLRQKYRTIDRLSNHGMYDPDRTPEAEMSANQFLSDFALQRNLKWGPNKEKIKPRKRR